MFVILSAEGTAQRMEHVRGRPSTPVSSAGQQPRSPPPRRARPQRQNTPHATESARPELRFRTRPVHRVAPPPPRQSPTLRPPRQASPPTNGRAALRPSRSHPAPEERKERGHPVRKPPAVRARFPRSASPCRGKRCRSGAFITPAPRRPSPRPVPRGQGKRTGDETARARTPRERRPVL